MTNTTPHPGTRPEPAVPTSAKTNTPHNRERWDHGCTNALVKSPSISTKGIRTRSTTRHPKAPSHTPRTRINLASTFGTLLSSQGADAHQPAASRPTRRGNPSSLGRPFRRSQIRGIGLNWIGHPGLLLATRPSRGRASGATSSVPHPTGHCRTLCTTCQAHGARGASLL